MWLQIFPICIGSGTEHWILFNGKGFETPCSFWSTLQNKLPPKNRWNCRFGTSRCRILSFPDWYTLVYSWFETSKYLHWGFPTLTMFGPFSSWTSGTSVPCGCLLEETTQYWNGIRPFLSWDIPEPVREAGLVSYCLWWQFDWRPTTQHARFPRFGVCTEYIRWQRPCW